MSKLFEILELKYNTRAAWREPAPAADLINGYLYDQ